VLRLMRRRYNTRVYRERIDAVLAALPHAGIGIDVIVGMPGETEELFREGYEFLVDLPFSYLHVFSYSERPGTEAAGIAEKIAPAERARRSQMLRTLSQRKRRAFYESQLGRTLHVLFESGEKGSSAGFSENYVRVTVPWQPGLENRILPVRCEALEKDSVAGTLLETPADWSGYIPLQVVGE
jgi:threonylcarbamoyladenosine tRNA methylthiotransferase MtaB